MAMKRRGKRDGSGPTRSIPAPSYGLLGRREGGLCGRNRAKGSIPDIASKRN